MGGEPPVLGVPKGYGIEVPGFLRNDPRYKDQPADQCTYVQSVGLQTHWHSRKYSGKTVPAAQAGKFLADKLPRLI